MTIAEAVKAKNDYYKTNTHTEDEIFMFTEAMEYLISETRDPKYMLELGGYYYDERKFGLALKYYEMSAAFGYPAAYLCLGYVWYYGRTGERDFKKAFEYFSKGAEKGDINSEYKLADMYKNGYYVEKDYDKYVSMIEGLYPRVKNAQYTNEHLPEVFTRLAAIRKEQGNVSRARNLYNRARGFLEQRIRYSNFFGNLNIMKRLIHDYYSITEFNKNNISLYDLYYLLEDECEVRFREGFEEIHTVKVFYDNDTLVISLDGGQYFRTVDDFFAKANSDGTLLTDIFDILDGFEVIAWRS